MTLPIQRLGERARASYASHLSALPRDDVRLRFGAPLGREGIDAYVARIDFDTDAVFAAHDDRLEPAGVAHVGIVEGTVSRCCPVIAVEVSAARSSPGPASTRATAASAGSGCTASPRTPR